MCSGNLAMALCYVCDKYYPVRTSECVFLSFLVRDRVFNITPSMYKQLSLRSDHSIYHQLKADYGFSTSCRTHAQDYFLRPGEVVLACSQDHHWKNFPPCAARRDISFLSSMLTVSIPHLMALFPVSLCPHFTSSR